MRAVVLAITDLSVSHGESAARRGVSLGVATGQVVVIVCPNGAGTTRLFKAGSGTPRPARLSRNVAVGRL